MGFANPAVIHRVRLVLGLLLVLMIPGFELHAQQTQPPQAPQPAPQPAAKPVQRTFQSEALPNYAKPVPQLPTIIGPYMRRTIPKPKLENSPRIETLIHEGKL